jgi:hypothetical protein
MDPHSVSALFDKWIIIGDLNMILSVVDKSNDNLNKRLMGDFRAVVRDLELKELSLRGRKFMWSDNQTQTRIDLHYDLGFDDAKCVPASTIFPCV